MRRGGRIGVILLVCLVVAIVPLWLLFGVLAAWQRGYFGGGDTSCASNGSIAVTVIAGPLNYAGVNPTVDCHVHMPQPSSMDAAHLYH